MSKRLILFNSIQNLVLKFNQIKKRKALVSMTLSLTNNKTHSCDFKMIQTYYWGSDSYLSNINENHMFFTLSYVPPYEKLDLGKLQIAEREQNIFSEPITIIINLSEWLGHEKEEYFTISTKFFFDMRSKWKYIFTINSKDVDAIKDMFIIFRSYKMFGTLELDQNWETLESLKKHIAKDFDWSLESASLFAKLLHSPDFDSYKTDLFIDTVSEEIRTTQGCSKITIDEFEAYLKFKNGIVSLLCEENISKFDFIKGVTKNYDTKSI